MAGKTEFADELKKWLGTDSGLASRAAADAMVLRVSTNLAALTVALPVALAPIEGSSELAEGGAGKAAMRRPRP